MLLSESQIHCNCETSFTVISYTFYYRLHQLMGYKYLIVIKSMCFHSSISHKAIEEYI